MARPPFLALAVDMTTYPHIRHRYYPRAKEHKDLSHSGKQ